jgi:hypothetical protein
MEPVQKWLLAKRTVHSVDQSSATDRFPLILQKFYLHCAGCPKEWIRSVHLISKMPYEVDSRLVDVVGSQHIKITCGNPMGAGYSMPLYTLTLIALIKGACVAWGFEDAFRVLGDDVVIADDGLAKWFIEFLPKLGVEISTTKGVSSSVVAEFVGASITDQDYVFPGQWKIPSKRNIYQLVKHHGQPLPWLPKQRDHLFQRAIGAALIKEQVYSPHRDIDHRGLIPPLAVPCSPDRIERVKAIEAMYPVDSSKVDEWYLQYTQNRVISTLRSLSGKLLKGDCQVIGTYIDGLIRRTLWDSPLIDKFEGTEWERDSYHTLDILCDAFQRVVEVAINPQYGSAFKSWTKASGNTRDFQLASRFVAMADWLTEWVERSDSYTIVRAYFVFEGFSSLLDHIFGFLAVESHRNKWRVQEARYERFVQFVMHMPQ